MVNINDTLRNHAANAKRRDERGRKGKKGDILRPSVRPGPRPRPSASPSFDSVALFTRQSFLRSSVLSLARSPPRRSGGLGLRPRPAVYLVSRSTSRRDVASSLHLLSNTPRGRERSGVHVLCTGRLGDCTSILSSFNLLAFCKQPQQNDRWGLSNYKAKSASTVSGKRLLATLSYEATINKVRT